MRGPFRVNAVDIVRRLLGATGNWRRAAMAQIAVGKTRNSLSRAAEGTTHRCLSSGKARSSAFRLMPVASIDF